MRRNIGSAWQVSSQSSHFASETVLILRKTSLDQNSSRRHIHYRRLFGLWWTYRVSRADYILEQNLFMLDHIYIHSGQVYGFKYWHDPGAFPRGVQGVIDALVLASFSMQGTNVKSSCC